MRKVLIISFLIISKAYSQPFLDVVKVGYTNQTNVKNPNQSTTLVQDYNYELSLPLPINDNLIILSGIDYYQYNLDFSVKSNLSIKSLQLHTGFLKKWNKKWSSTFLVINKLNTNQNFSYKRSKSAQFGSLFLLSDKINEEKTWKFGVYINKDIYSMMLVPIIGYDINLKNNWNISGAFPIHTTIRKMASEKMHYGLYYRGMITSFE